MADNNRAYRRADDEEVISAAEVVLQMRQGALPSGNYFIMLGLAGLIAAFGLIANSAPAIIGAMVVAPLMSPIMSLAYALVSNDRRLMLPALLSIVAGAVLVVVIAYVVTDILGLRIVGSEILARTSPTLIDLGVAIAAGAVGAFAFSRRSIMTSIAGVAIAVALVPPLAVTGIGLAMGRDAIADNTLSLSVVGLHAGGQGIAYGAFVLFFTNFVGILFIAVLVFFAQRYGSWQRTVLALLLCLCCSLLVLKPLSQAFRTLHLRDITVRAISAITVESPEFFPRAAKLEPARITYRDGVNYIYLQMLGPRLDAAQLQQGVVLIRDKIGEATDMPVVLELDYIGVDLLQASAPLPVGSEQALTPAP